MMIDINQLSRRQMLWLNGLVNIMSVLLCALLLPTRWPGMELLGIAPNWLMLWVIAWSVKRSIWEGAVAGAILGIVQDSMSGSQFPYNILWPSHVLGLVVVGVLTALLQKQRYIQEELASIALIAFFMSFLNEGITAVQYLLQAQASLLDFSNPLWLRYQQVAIGTAVLGSLWMPVLYYPLNWWWQKVEDAE
jgi:rod shape-determining protein MreD